MAVGKFVDPRSIDPIWFDTSHHVTPDGAAGQDIIVVLRDALRDGGRAALSRLVMAQRERTVAILAMDAGMVCHTLHAPRELYDAKSLFGRFRRRRRMRQWCGWRGSLPSGRRRHSRPRAPRIVMTRACAQ